MKLNYKRTILVGMAFFLISAFWQSYDVIIALILDNHFGLLQSASGAVMAIDNVLAVFLLPVFGALSDKVNTKYGRRTPFIFIGSICAVIAYIGLTLIDQMQIKLLQQNNIAEIATNMDLSDPEQVETLRKMLFSITEANPWIFVGFIVTLLVVLVSMATFRSPAVALMPDVTVKPLRSKANAIINLTGTAGAISILVLVEVFAVKKGLYNVPYTGFVVAVAGIMLAGLVVFLLTVKEPKWSKEMQKESARLGIEEASEETSDNTEKHKLSRPELISLILILASVALWYIGYNSITTKYAVYVTKVLDGFSISLPMIVAQAAAIITYIPVGIIASKVGRKKSILAGIILLTTAFFAGNFVDRTTPEGIMYPIFILAGIGWATINVNSFPMVVELAKGSDTGKYTGYYYTASMAAQIIAPVLSGFLYDVFGMRNMFFAFGTVFVALSFVTMFFVKHGDAKPVQKKSALENLDVGD